MSNKNPTNIAASIRTKLLNQAKKDQRPFEELLQYYAMERFLYRLSQSEHANRFILKGALLFKVWESTIQRPTMDIDMLGVTSNEEEKIATQFHDIIGANVISDGLIFDPASLSTSRILEDADYEGINVKLSGKLDSAKIYIQVDIGFGDIVYPRPEKESLPTLLDLPAPNLLCYSKHSAIAEKFDAMVSRGMANSRMKDFYDVWLLSRRFNFEGPQLAEAIRLTLNQRGTVIPNEIEAFSDKFINDKPTQWAAFRKRLKLEHIPESFSDVIASIKAFLIPISEALSSSTSFAKTWVAPGSWK